MLLAACAQTGGRQAGGEEPCNPVVGAVIGGAVGAIAGGDRNRAGRALIGAGVGALACMAINYNTRQTRSAEQVGADYRARNSDQLPPAPVVTAYRTQTERGSARAGEDITVTSTIEVVPGRSEPLKELREEFAIVDPSGVERRRRPAARAAPTSRRCNSRSRRACRRAPIRCSRGCSSTAGRPRARR
jgi:hypothetical protein